jgi:NitT/TauT family transport system permease protein
MNTFQKVQQTIASLMALFALYSFIFYEFSNSFIFILALIAFLGVVRIFYDYLSHGVFDFLFSIMGMVLLIIYVYGSPSYGFWPLLISVWLYGWMAVEKITHEENMNLFLRKLFFIIVPIFFGAWILFTWEVITVGLNVPMVILPSPSLISLKFVDSLDTLWADFVQTFVKAALSGYLIGCGSAFIVAIMIDKSLFLRRGLLPIGNFISAIPIVGIAPIMIMWFGFDWHSKAAVVVIMTFFPMLVNTVTGLSVTNPIERDLLKTYASSYTQSLILMRLPAAAPFIFNALKINSTLALIGAIIAEFFGSPTVGLGFRISVEVGRLNLDMVWAEIAVAALVGSASYGVISFIEKKLTFWHPSNRRTLEN